MTAEAKLYFPTGHIHIYQDIRFGCYNGSSMAINQDQTCCLTDLLTRIRYSRSIQEISIGKMCPVSEQTVVRYIRIRHGFYLLH